MKDDGTPRMDASGERMPEDSLIERFAAAQDALLRRGRPPAAFAPALRFAGRLCDAAALRDAGWVHLTGLSEGREPALWRGDVWLARPLEEDGRRFLARLALSPPLREEADGALAPLAPGEETRRAYDGADPFLASVRWVELAELALGPARIETPPRDLPPAVARRVCDDLQRACRPGGSPLLRALAAAADGRTYVGSRDLSPAERTLELLADAVAERIGADGAGLPGARAAVAAVAAPLWDRLDPDGAAVLAGVRDPDVWSRFLVLALHAGVPDALPALLCAQLRDPARLARLSPLDWDAAASAARAAGLFALEAACLRRAVRAGACADAFHPRLLAACRAHFASLRVSGAPAADNVDALALLDSLRADCAASPAWLVLRGLAGLAAAEPADAPPAADAATAALPAELGEALAGAVARHRAEHCLAREDEVVPSLAAPVEWQAALVGAGGHPRLVRRALAALPAPMLSLGFPGEDSLPRSFARGPAPDALWSGLFPDLSAAGLAERAAGLADAATRPFDRPQRLASEERTDSAPLDWLLPSFAPAAGVGVLAVRGAAGKTPPDGDDPAPALLRALPLPGAGAPLEASVWAFRVWEKNVAADAKLFVRDLGPLWAVWPEYVRDRPLRRRGERLAVRLAFLATALEDAPAGAAPGFATPAGAEQPSFRSLCGTVVSVRTGLSGPGGLPVAALELDAGPDLPFRPVLLAGADLAAAARPGAAVRADGWFVARPDLDAPAPAQVPWREDEPAARAARGGPAFVRTEFADDELAALGPGFEPGRVDFARAALDELRHRPAVRSASAAEPNPEGVDLVADVGGAPRRFAVEALAAGEPPRRALAPGVERLVVRTAPAPGGLDLSYAEFPL